MKCPKCHQENPETKQFCADCGTRLIAVGAAQASFTKTLETPADELSRGTVFAGRYEIIEELGAGGMGRVYRAYDRKVEEEVALKLIRPEIAADRRTLERFRNEIKTARMITHKNVCRTHDLGEEGRSLFITMEYVRGEDLKSLIRKTRSLTTGASVELARQVAEGLGEAHRLGVVHRDLKPGNIMIDRHGVAKIMDFGIARSPGGRGTTAEGAIIGTPEYMSPEQVEGKTADARADIYALGVVLFEMVTGRPPFEGGTAFSVANKQLSEPAPDPRMINPQIPEDLSRLILRCLEKEKDKRFRSTDDLLSELETIEATLPMTDRAPTGQASTGDKATPSKTVTVTFALKKAAMFAAIAITLAAAVVLFLWKPWSGRKNAFVAPNGNALAVLNFENTSRDEALDDWKTGIPLLLTTDLRQSKYLSVISYEEVYGILKNLGLQDAGGFSSDDLARIARESRSAYTATGGIMRAGERIIVVLSVKNHVTGEDQPAKFECVGEAGIPSLVDSMTTRIKEILGLTRSQVSGDIDAEAVDISTGSMEALKLYNQGRRLHVSLEHEKSVPLMLLAVEKDPEFAMAYRSLSASLNMLGRREESRRYLKLALDHSGKASAKERFWIQIDFYEQSERTYDQALEACRDWLGLYPDDTHAMMLTGRQYLYREDFDLAVEFLGASVRKGEVNPYAFYWLSLAHNIMGAYEKGRQAADLGFDIHPDSPLIELSLFDGYVAQGKIGDASAWLEKWSVKNPGLAADLRMGDLLILQGRHAEAAAVFAKYDPSDYQYIGWRLPFLRLSEGKIGQAFDLARSTESHSTLVYLNYRVGHLEEALAESQKALKSAMEEGSLRNQAWALQIRGQVELAMGSTDAAKRTVGELETCVRGAPIQKLARHYYFLLGMIEREAGRFSAAAAYLRKGIALLPGESWELGSYWHSLFFDGLAGIYFKAGDLVRAKETYRKIQSLALAQLRYGDIYASSFYWLGRIAEKEGNKAEAVENYRKYLNLWKDADADLPEVADAKERLTAIS